MARARIRLPDDLEHLTKDEMTRSIDQACLGIEDTLIAQQYLLDRLPQVDVAAEIGCDRSPSRAACRTSSPRCRIPRKDYTNTTGPGIKPRLFLRTKLHTSTHRHTLSPLRKEAKEG